MLVYIGLGSNLQEPIEQIECALAGLEQMDGGWLSNFSSLYRSPPMGPQNQPDYLNAVAEIETTLAPLELLDRLQQIEGQQGRVRGRRWGERIIDLDLLLYGDEIFDHPRLQIPHPGIAERLFVLLPMEEVAGPDLEIPGLGRVGELLKKCKGDEITKVRQ